MHAETTVPDNDATPAEVVPDATAAFVGQFFAGLITPEEFNHRAHLELAYGLIRDEAWPVALERLARGLREFSAQAGAPLRYHATLTIALAHIVRARMRAAPLTTFDEFLAANPDLVSDARQLVLAHYRESTLASDEARQAWLPPDLKSFR